MSWLIFICLCTAWLTVLEAKFHHEVAPIHDDSGDLSDNVIQDLKHEILLMRQEYDRKLEQLGRDYNLIKLRTESLSEENKELEKKMTDCIIRHDTGQMESYSNSTASNQDLATGVVAFLARQARFVGDGFMQIPFDMVLLNIGDAYVRTGLFTAPTSGLYHFVSVMLPDSKCGTDDTCFTMNINGVILLGACSTHYPTSVALTATVQLSAGDNVTNHFSLGCYEIYDNNDYNWFSGYLLHESIY